MVRLKEQHHNLLMSLLKPFQFLMVRLKGTTEAKGGTGKSYFNSLWCD